MANEVDQIYIELKNWDLSNFGKSSADDLSYFNAELQEYVKIRGCKLLDVGFGNANLYHWCINNKISYHGVEVNQILLERAKLDKFTAYRSLDEAYEATGGDYFDLIVAFDVLEHVNKKELPTFFKSINKLMTRQGYFIARFPNGDSPFGRAYQNGDMSHETTIGTGALIQLTKESGFSIVKMNEPSTPITLKRPLQALVRSALLFIRKSMNLIISTVYFNGNYKNLSANIVAIMKIKSK